MLRHCLIISLFIVLVNPSIGQDFPFQKRQINRWPAAIHYNQGQNVDSTTIMLVADNGTHVASYDMGFNWVQKEFPTNADLNDLYFVHRDTGFVCADQGIVYRTHDGGYSWTEVSPPTDRTLSTMYFFNGSEGLVAGDSTIFKTYDGGQNWVSVPALMNTWIADVNFEGDFGLALADGGSQYFSTNRGDKWSILSSLTDDQYLTSFFLNRDTFFVGGRDHFTHDNLWVTTDGGNSFSILKTTYSTISSIWFGNFNHGWLQQLFPAYTSNSGQSFNRCYSSNLVGQFNNGILFQSHFNMPIKAGQYGYIGFLDTACRFLETSSGDISSINGIDFLTDFEGYANTSNHIIGTTDGGYLFSDTLFTDTTFLHSIFDFSCISDSIFYVLIRTGYLLRTNDRFNSLDTLYGIGNTSGPPAQIWTFGMDTVFLYKRFGGSITSKLLRSFDGGQSWDTIALGNRFEVPYFLNQERIWLVDYQVDKKVFKSENGGNSWDTIPFNPTLFSFSQNVNSSKLLFFDSLNGFMYFNDYASGPFNNWKSYYFFTTNDGGLTWSFDSTRKSSDVSFLIDKVDINGVTYVYGNSLYEVNQSFDLIPKRLGHHGIREIVKKPNGNYFGVGNIGLRFEITFDTLFPEVHSYEVPPGSKIKIPGSSLDLAIGAFLNGENQILWRTNYDTAGIIISENATDGSIFIYTKTDTAYAGEFKRKTILSNDHELDLGQNKPIPRIYPNPSTGNIYLESSKSGKFNWQIRSILGQKMSSGVCNTSHCMVNTSDLESGIYIVQFFIEECDYSLKFIKE